MTDRLLRSMVAAVTALAGLCLAIDAPSPLRVTALVVFLVSCPGLAWSRRFGLADPGDVLAVAGGLSLALAAIVAEAMALTRSWSPELGFGVLAAVTVAGLAVRPAPVRA